MTMQRYDEPDSRITVGAMGMGANDFIPPRVKILQQMSQEVVDKKGEAGDYYNTLTSEVYGPAIRFIPLFTFMNRVFIVRSEKKADLNLRLENAGMDPLPEGDGLMCRSTDTIHGQGDPGIECALCPLSQWEGRTGAPPCSEVYNLAAFTEQGDVIFLGFSKSAAKVGKKVNSILRMQVGKKPWDMIWSATTDLVRNDRGNFYVPEVVPTKDPTPPELKGEAVAFARQFAGVRLDLTEQEAAQQQEGTTADADLPF